MGLAHMLNVDRTAVICDLAETYHIFSMEQLPARTVATLACGLKPDSRIMMKMAGVQTSPPNLLLFALIVDELRLLRYSFMGDKKHKPVLVTDLLENGIPQKETISFSTGAEFDAYRAKILEKVK